MSENFHLLRNSYLHGQSSSVDAKIINKAVERAILQPPYASIFGPSWFRLKSEQPNIPIDNVDVTRRPVAFGRLALPKLRRELHDKDDYVVIQALYSLCDLAKDPEKALEAIVLKIPDRLADKLLDPLPPIRENSVMLLKILAEYGDGREAIVSNNELLDNIILGLGDEQIEVRYQIAGCFEMISRSWIAADVLVEKELIQMLLEIIDKDELPQIVLFHLRTLKSLMYECGKCIVLKNNGFRIYLKYLDHEDSDIVCKALDCLAILCSTKKGKKLAIRHDLLKTLNRLLHYGNDEVCKSAACVIMFCTVKSRIKVMAGEIKSLTKRLVKLATNPLNVGLQMFCLKALTNISENPLIRKEICERYLDELYKLQVDETNKEYKDTLLTVTNWVPDKM